MAKAKNNKKKFLRITLSQNKHNDLKNRAEQIDVSITSYVKLILFGDRNG